jgi:hypothetical protein
MDFTTRMAQLYQEVEKALQEAGYDLLNKISKEEQFKVVKNCLMGIPTTTCTPAAQKLAKIVNRRINRRFDGKN